MKMTPRGQPNVEILSEEHAADCLTPMMALLRLRTAGQPAFLLESVEGGENLARYSFVGVEAVEEWRIRGERLEHRRIPGEFVTVAESAPLARLTQEIARFRAPPPVAGRPPFAGGFVGFLSYECAGYLEKLPRSAEPAATSEARLLLFRSVLAFDHAKGSLSFMECVLPEEGARGHAAAKERIARWRERLAKPVAAEGWQASSSQPATQGWKPLLGPKRFAEGVAELKKAIRRGDIFQGVLSEEFEFEMTEEPLQAYRRLRAISPAPYLYFLDFGDETLLGASPERLVKVEGRRIETHPIAGTRPRGVDEADDLRKERDLLASVKERAEHVMLVDLGRNDLGRVSKPGTVRVAEFQQVKRFSHVMHLVSRVEGELARGKSPWDALLAAFPAGTLTGAPKIRAMELIARLEPRARGPYGGAVVYSDFSGNLDSCITIRSLHVKDGVGRVRAGAGVVADSRADREYEEIRNKSAAIRRALGGEL